MRKTSHDGGDSTSITSGVENEIKKSAMKPKKSSLKKRAPNFSHESDDTVIEPLLQKDKEKTESTPSAKYITKGKTDSLQEKERDNKAKTTSTAFCGTTESLLSLKESSSTNTTSGVMAPLHNYMNTNVFNTHGNSKANVATKSQILVEIDGCKQSGYNPSPLIFTTAKIHTDGKTKHMEPVQMTPVPILSTIEASMSKGGNITTNEKKISNGSSVISPGYSTKPVSKLKEEKATENNISTSSSITTKDTFGITMASTSKLSSDTPVQSSSMEKSLPATTSKTLSMGSYKDKQSKDVEQTFSKNVQPQSKTFNLDNSKNDVTVKASTTSSAKVNMVDTSVKSVKTNQGVGQNDTSQPNKLDANSDNKILTNVSSSVSQPNTTNVITPTTSKSSIQTQSIDPVITTGITSGIKLLQRQQKTTTDETSTPGSKINANTKSVDESSAKSSFSKKDFSQPKVIGSTVVKDSDKLPKISANNTQSVNTKPAFNTTGNFTTNVTNIPTVTSVIISSTVPTPTNVTSKPTANVERKISPTITTTNVLSNINKTNTITTPITGATAITKTAAANAAKATAIPILATIEKSPELTSAQLVSSVNKTVSAKKPDATTSAVIKTTQVNSLNSKAVVTPTAFATVTSVSSPAITKIPTLSTAAKTTSVSSITNTTTKPSSIISQATANNKVSTSIKTPAATTSIKMTPVSTTVPTTTTAQKNPSVSITASKQPTTTTSTSTVTRKPSTVSSPENIKSPNNNSSQASAFSKPSTTSGSKANPSATVPKTSAMSSTASVATTSTIKSPQASSSSTKTTKEGTVSVKKPMVTKTPSSVDTCIKTVKQSASTDKSVLPKSLATSTKTPSVTAVSTTSSTATKPSTSNSTQLVSNKSGTVAGASQPTAVHSRPLDSTKKEESKSSECNKVSKA